MRDLITAADSLIDYCAHETGCILSDCSAGEPTENGGYRRMYRGAWYQTRPVDETPKCTCGLDEAQNVYDTVRARAA